MTITRRAWLEAAGTALAAAVLPSVSACSDGSTPLPSYAYTGTPGPLTMFDLGVASGDPLADAVILWTHVASGTADPVDVWLDVATDPAFARRVVARSFACDASTDFTLKVDLDGLRAGTTYYYRFFALGIASPVGRTRTLPTGSLGNARFGVATCANLGYGYFHAYGRLAERSDLDAVLFLGDYIYEYANDFYPFTSQRVRNTAPNTEVYTLDEYRLRYRTYRADPDLREAHRQHPWIAVWDDHEVEDNSYPTGAQGHIDAIDGPYAPRLAAAKQAYFEYLPIRGTPAQGIHRSFRFGDLVDLLLLDTRLEGRSPQLANAAALATEDPTRSMLGAAQETWLSEQLAASAAKWRVLGQQIVVAQFSSDAATHVPDYLDQWDGYPAARGRLFDAIENDADGNVVVLTGDLHGACVFDVARDPYSSAYDPATGAGSIAVEFVVTSVTSPYAVFGVTNEDTLLTAASPHLAWTNLRDRGYTIVDVTPQRLHADFYKVADVTSLSGGAATWLAGYEVPDGTTHAVAAAEVPAKTGPLPAP